MVWAALDYDTGRTLTGTIPEECLRRLHEAFNHRFPRAGLEWRQEGDIVDFYFGHNPIHLGEQILKQYTCIQAPDPPPPTPSAADSGGTPGMAVDGERVWTFAVAYFTPDYALQFTHLHRTRWPQRWTATADTFTLRM